MKEGWLGRNSMEMKTVMRILFGVVWFIDGSFKFSFDTAQLFPQLIRAAAQGQPHWLMPWFNFWLGVVSQNPGLWVYAIGTGELLIGLGLIFGVMRKVTYTAGFFLSLLIWAVPEGLGGPYGPGATDIGTGIIYSFVFLLLMIINAKYGTSRYSLDYYIEKHLGWWKRIAEFG